MKKGRRCVASSVVLVLCLSAASQWWYGASAPETQCAANKPEAEPAQPPLRPV